MSGPAYFCDTIFGLGGEALDPAGGMRSLNQKAGALGWKIQSSPWQEEKIENVYAAIVARPADSIQSLIGDSCGANRIAWLVALLAAHGRKVRYAAMIQASEYCNAGCPPLGPALAEGLVIFSDVEHTGGLGTFKPPLAVPPALAPGESLYDGKPRTGNNGHTIIRYQYVPAFHPDDQDVTRVQAPILADLKRIMTGD